MICLLQGYEGDGYSSNWKLLGGVAISAAAAAAIVAATNDTSTSSCEAAPTNGNNNGVKTTDFAVRAAKTNEAWTRDKESYASYGGMKLFTGNSNKPLADDIAAHLGISLGKITVGHFADGEVNVVINENVRGKDVFIVQPTSPPVNETLMELLLMTIVKMR